MPLGLSAAKYGTPMPVSTYSATPVMVSNANQAFGPSQVVLNRSMAQPMVAQTPFANPALSRVPYSPPMAPLYNTTVPITETPIHYTPHNWCWWWSDSSLANQHYCMISINKPLEGQEQFHIEREYIQNKGRWSKRAEMSKIQRNLETRMPNMAVSDISPPLQCSAGWITIGLVVTVLLLITIILALAKGN